MALEEVLQHAAIKWNSIFFNSIVEHWHECNELGKKVEKKKTFNDESTGVTSDVEIWLKRSVK